MPAVMRGAAKRGRSSSSGKSGGSRRKPAYAPAKLAAGARVGLDPRQALAAAGLVLIAGLGLMLATGGRAQALSAAVSTSVDHRIAAMGFRLAKVKVEGARRRGSSGCRATGGRRGRRAPSRLPARAGARPPGRDAG